MRSPPGGLVYVCVAFIAACGNADSTAPATGLEGGQRPYACNAAEDVECAIEQELALDAVSALGFSANDVLPSIVGNYEIPIRWVSPCTDATGCPSLDDCSRFAEQPPVSVAGATTTLTLQLAAVGPAEAMAPGPGQDACEQYVQIPATLTVQTEDGAVDAEDEVVVWTECGNELSVGVVGPASHWGGKLGAELGDGAISQLSFGATREGQVWFRLSYIRQVEDAPRPVTLWAEMLLGDPTCYELVPRGDVLAEAE
jgi:hypothetical protein